VDQELVNFEGKGEVRFTQRPVGEGVRRVLRMSKGQCGHRITPEAEDCEAPPLTEQGDPGELDQNTSLPPGGSDSLDLRLLPLTLLTPRA
jgi:hypothetical protein